MMSLPVGVYVAAAVPFVVWAVIIGALLRDQRRGR